MLAAARQLLLGAVLAGCVGSGGVLAERLIARHHALRIVISLHCLLSVLFFYYAYLLNCRFSVSIHISSFLVGWYLDPVVYKIGF